MLRPQHCHINNRQPLERPSAPSPGLAFQGTGPSSPVEGLPFKRGPFSGVRHSSVYPIAVYRYSVIGPHPPTAKICEQLWDLLTGSASMNAA